MFVLLLVYVVAVIYASPHKIRDDLFMQDLTEDSSLPFEPANTNILDDGTLVSSAAISVDDSKGDLFLSSVDAGSTDAVDFGQGSDVGKDLPMENFDLSSLDANGGQESSVGNMAFPLESSNPEADPPIDILDSSISTAPCNSQSDSSIKSSDSSASTTLQDLEGNPILIASDDSPGASRGKPNSRYTIEPTYELGPYTGPYTYTSDAYAEDGTAIKPGRCPSGTKKACCRDYTNMVCWFYPGNPQLCRYAKNLYCCGDVPEIGGPGTDCQTMKWIYERGRANKTPPPDQPNQLQGVFDIFQFPDLNPNPNPSYCPSPSRF